MDIVSRSVRSQMMRNIQGKNTEPELVVRSIAHALGLRFRLYDKKLPGTPDLVLRRHRTAIFVHGCFWHRHGCALTAVPKTRTEFWMAKFEANQRRDARNREELQALGWRVLEIWECETRRPAMVRVRLAEFFGLVAAVESLPTAGGSLPATVEQCAPPLQHKRRSRTP
ncbi:very short patch repair endonuclease [Ralstonia nicotianae]